MSLPVPTLLVLLDSIAKQVEIFEAAVGPTGSEPNTVSRGAANNVETVLGVPDAAVQAVLMSTFRARALALRSGMLERMLGGAAVQRVLSLHYGDAAAGLNQVLQTADVRVHPLLRSIGFQIDPANCFCPSSQTAATFAVSGGGVGVFTPGTAIDDSQYGKANMRVRSTTVIGGASIAATLSMIRADGGVDSKVVTIPGGSVSGFEAAIGIPGTDMYVSCAGMSITGGTNGDGFSVVSQVERTIAL